MQFTIAERENSSFYGKEKTTHNYIIPFKHNRKCIIYSLYIIKLHGSHCFSSSSLLKRRENSSSALECCLFARVFALTILMNLSARTAAFFFNVCTKPYTLNTTEGIFPQTPTKKKTTLCCCCFLSSSFSSCRSSQSFFSGLRDSIERLVRVVVISRIRSIRILIHRVWVVLQR